MYRRAIDYQQQSLEITREIGDRRGEAHTLQNLGAAYNKCGRLQEVFSDGYQAQLILQELELPLSLSWFDQLCVVDARRDYLPFFEQSNHNNLKELQTVASN